METVKVTVPKGWQQLTIFYDDPPDKPFRRHPGEETVPDGISDTTSAANMCGNRACLIQVCQQTVLCLLKVIHHNMKR